MRAWAIATGLLATLAMLWVGCATGSAVSGVGMVGHCQAAMGLASQQVAACAAACTPGTAAMALYTDRDDCAANHCTLGDLQAWQVVAGQCAAVGVSYAPAWPGVQQHTLVGPREEAVP